MKSKFKLFFTSLICFQLFTLSIASSINAFYTGSFTQKAGTGYIWEVQMANYSTVSQEIANVGDRLRLEITFAGYGGDVCCGNYGDVLYGDLSNNSLTDRSWTSYETNTFLALYNITTGFFKPGWLFFIPHNETVVNSSLYNLFTSDWNYENYNWINGTSGYDGIASGFNGSIIGDFNQSKQEFEYNINGVLIHFKEYNGTGSGWELVYHLTLIDSYTVWDPIPTIIIVSSIAIASIGFYLFLDYRKKRNPQLKRTKI